MNKTNITGRFSQNQAESAICAKRPLVKTFFHTLLSISIVLVSLSMQVKAQEVSDVMKNEIIQAVESGNARDLAKYFGNNVELTLPGNEGTFSKSQSEIIIREFFSRNSVADFQINHQGASRDGSTYMIGTYLTVSKKSFRTYFLLKKVGDSFVLHQVQFQESRN